MLLLLHALDSEVGRVETQDSPRRTRNVPNTNNDSRKGSRRRRRRRTGGGTVYNDSWKFVGGIYHAYG